MQIFEITKSSGYSPAGSIQVALPSRNVCNFFKLLLTLNHRLYIYIRIFPFSYQDTFFVAVTLIATT